MQHFVYHWFWLDFWTPVWPNLVASLVVWAFMWFYVRAMRDMQKELAEVKERQVKHHKELKAVLNEAMADEKPPAG